MWNLFPDFRQYPRYFFVDMNAFYCSVEQQECAQYRGKPTIVVPVLTDTTCAIAASYEAKAHGVKTGASVGLARSHLPQLQIVEARPELYLRYHDRLVALLRDHFASVKVLSVDEMACRIPPLWRTAQEEAALARRIKDDLTHELGECLRCSVGIGPNIFLAKVASDRQKPDGLTIWNEDNLPDALFAARLDDLPGIGPGVKRRLRECRIHTVEHLWQANPIELRRAWGSVMGERFYYMLRGSHECDYRPAQAEGVARKSVSHSNVLAPEHRSREGAERMLLALIAKALKRLRAYQALAGAAQITVRYRRTGEQGARRFNGKEAVWMERSGKHLPAHDDLTWMRILRPILDAAPDLSPSAEPCYVGIVFSELLACQDKNLSLFEEEEERERLASAVDGLQAKHGSEAVDLGVFRKKAEAPLRIPFGVPEARL